MAYRIPNGCLVYLFHQWCHKKGVIRRVTLVPCTKWYWVHAMRNPRISSAETWYWCNWACQALGMLAYHKFYSRFGQTQQRSVCFMSDWILARNGDSHFLDFGNPSESAIFWYSILNRIPTSYVSWTQLILGSTTVWCVITNIAACTHCSTDFSGWPCKVPKSGHGNIVEDFRS